MNSVPMDIEGDAFGKIYEYFLGKFARVEGQKGGKCFYFYFSPLKHRAHFAQYSEHIYSI